MIKVNNFKETHANFILRTLGINAVSVEVEYKSEIAADFAGGGDCTTRAIYQEL